MAKLTDKAVRAAKAEDGDTFMCDGGGLYLRVRSSGLKLWLYRYKVGTTTRWMELGSYPDLPLADARTKAAGATAKRRQGIDPVGEREAEAARREAEAIAEAAALAANAARLSVRDLFGRWESVDLVRRKDGGAEVRRMFEKDVLPKIGDLAVEDIRKGHITGVTDALLARGVIRMAKVIFSLMRQMFRFAVDRDIIEFDPTASIRKVAIGGKDTERDRVLSEDEIRALAIQIPDANLLSSTETAVWLALATCCRIGELLGARWEHVDLDKQIWWIPADASKNGKAHTVYLSDFAARHFRILKQAADNELAELQRSDPEAKPTPWVYPNRRADNSVCPKTVTKQLGDRQRPCKTPMKGRARADKAESLVLPGGKWGPHDLRRTGATLMVSLGVLPEVAERCLNHTEQNRVKRTYQRHSYENEMRDAWQLLGGRLEILVSNPNNVFLLSDVAA